MSNEPVSESEIVSLKENILTLDAFLGPYPYDILDKWMNLSSYITDNLLSKLTPQCGQVKAALELQSCSDAERPRGDKQNMSQPSCSSTTKKRRLSQCDESDLLPSLKPLEGTELRLTPFPDRKYPEGSSPSEITQHSLDSTYVFEILLSQYKTFRIDEIIGELEFCFICFLVGHSLEAFDQWKKLVTLFCSCDLAIVKYRKLFDVFVTLLEVHIKEIPEEFLADIVSNNNFVYVNLKKMFQTIHSSSVDGQLKTKVNRFKHSLTETYLWDFEHMDSEEEDEAPVVVEI